MEECNDLENKLALGHRASFLSGLYLQEDL